MRIRHTLHILSFVLLTLLLSACVQEDRLPADSGTLHLSINKISSQTETRLTPGEIGKPLKERFSLKIQRTGSQSVYYNGNFKESIELPAGNYDITATYGENATIGKDCPYYTGTIREVKVEADKTTGVTIPCKVSNALISVKFGANEDEKARFDRYYKDYGLMVRVGDFSLPITREFPNSSIYFPAGSSPKLSFYGKLKMDNEREVSLELASDQFPATFDAADHAIITLGLPDPESFINVNISKVEVVTVTMGETIPLSWLPVSAVIPLHHYDENNILQGTNLIFSDSYPGMKWKAVVTNASGETVRTVTGKGELHSGYDNSDAWPYLPAGKYKATFYLVNGEEESKTASREFEIGKPTIEVKVGGYSSYTKYSEGDIDAANACERKTIYNPSVSVNISENLLNKYSYTFSYTYDGGTYNVEAGKNAYSVDKIEGQTVSFDPHVLKANVSFDGVAVETQKDFYITGLPINCTPPTEAQGWVAATDRITFSDNEVKLGALGGLTAHSNEYIYNNDFAIPAETKISMDYDVMIHPATVGTTLTITIGNNQLFAQTQNGGAFNTTDYPHKGTSITTLIEKASQLRCLNSYGGGNTGSHIYSLILKYSK